MPLFTPRTVTNTARHNPKCTHSSYSHVQPPGFVQGALLKHVSEALPDDPNVPKRGAGWSHSRLGTEARGEETSAGSSTELLLLPQHLSTPSMEQAGHSSACCPHPPASPGVCRNARLRLPPPEAFLLAARSLIFYPCRTEPLMASFPASSSRRCAPWDHPLSPFSTQRHCGPADPTAGRAGDLPSSASGLELLTPPFSSPLQGASKGRLKRPRREAQGDGCPPTHQGPSQPQKPRRVRLHPRVGDRVGSRRALLYLFQSSFSTHR